MSRPYRHTELDVLIRQHDSLQVRVYSMHSTGLWVSISTERRELRRLAREIDRRKVSLTVLSSWRNQDD